MKPELRGPRTDCIDKEAEQGLRICLSFNSDGSKLASRLVDQSDDDYTETLEIIHLSGQQKRISFCPISIFRLAKSDVELNDTSHGRVSNRYLAVFERKTKH